MTLRAPIAWLVLALTWLLPACGKEKLTAIVVAVDTDIENLDRVRVDVAGFGMQRLAGTEVSEENPLPRTLGLVHRGGPLGPISITVTGLRDGEPQLVERRARVYFVRDKVMMLRINLWRLCIDDDCAEGRTCDVVSDEPTCRDEEVDASELTAWTGKVPPLVPVDLDRDAGLTDDDGGMPPDSDAASDAGNDASPEPDAAEDAAMEAGTEPDAGMDAGSDSGGEPPCDGASCDATFGYTPSNFAPGASELGPGLRAAPTIDCNVTFDSDDLTPTDWCGTTVDPFTISQTTGGPDVTVVPLSALHVTTGGTLTLTGSRPVILAVFGDATIAGRIDASAVGSQPGAGGNASTCGTSTGANGHGNGGTGGGGGGGGGFATVGADGGDGGDNQPGMDVAGGVAGAPRNSTNLQPLIAGCGGGNGGDGDGAGGFGGAGGGAFQISASGSLTLAATARLAAAGGGGQASANQESGGGGGGSGGAVLLEADTLSAAAGAWLTANGGGGAEGSETDSALGMSGADGAMSSATPAPGGAGGELNGGDGGNGGVQGTQPSGGGLGDSAGVFESNDHGGGGGGGGVGRIHLRGDSSCNTASASYSPAATLACP